MNKHVNYDKQLIDACINNDISAARDAIWHGARNAQCCMLLTCYFGYFELFLILTKYCNLRDFADGLQLALSLNHNLSELSIKSAEYYFIPIPKEKIYNVVDRGFNKDRMQVILFLLSLLDGQLPKYFKHAHIMRIVNAGYPLDRLKYHPRKYNTRIIKNVATEYRENLTSLINKATDNIINWDYKNVTNIIIDYVDIVS